MMDIVIDLIFEKSSMSFSFLFVHSLRSILQSPFITFRLFLCYSKSINFPLRLYALLFFISDIAILFSRIEHCARLHPGNCVSVLKISSI